LRGNERSAFARSGDGPSQPAGSSFWFAESRGKVRRTDFQPEAASVTIASQTSIAIIGGGIGGLTAAASLLRAGFDVQVYEQTRTLAEVGAGINIGPNASRILHRLGIADELERTGVKPFTFDQRRWDDGRILLRSPLGEAVETAFGAPYYTFHRGDLHRALAKLRSRAAF
jgi:2-polyprenyl-6-methoxyphenol hydroxylase-like FAD-dependent oxidoreductase